MTDFQKYLFAKFSKCTVAEFDAQIHEVTVRNAEEEEDIVKMRLMLEPVEFDKFQPTLHVCCRREDLEDQWLEDNPVYVIDDYSGKPFSFLESGSPSIIVVDYKDLPFKEYLHAAETASIVIEALNTTSARSEINIRIGGKEWEYVIKKSEEQYAINPFAISGFLTAYLDLENVIVYSLVKDMTC